ncbi:uncharacterized protein L3040_008044 [Drepanopeziza brunnea f. sp. 'multigermtubi']|nr:hypothetical protein L3040_008044 [Drepanopeziza brunnea f. sp. 'multigermtubi']
MGDLDPAFVHALAAQSWVLYGVGMFLLLLRIYARIHRLGIKRLQTDDYLMLLAGGLYTALIACLNIIAGGGGSNLYQPGDFDTFTAKNIEERIKGSKIVLVSEQAMLNVIYVIKACMLIMYTRLTLGLQVQRMVVYLSVYVAVGWVATEIAFFTACTPFKGYWAMPPPNHQCTTLQNYAIVQACFNISSDFLMLFIPLPLVTKLTIPLKQKAVLILIFSMGTFIIVAAILTKVFNLSDVFSPRYMLWYTREASVAVYVSNLPMIWPLLREWFPSLKGFTPYHKPSPKGLSYSAGGTKPHASPQGHRGFAGGKQLHDTDFVTTTISATGEIEEYLKSGSTDSELGIVTRQSWEGNSASRPGLEGWDREFPGTAQDGGIHMTTTVEISEEYRPRLEVPRPIKATKTGSWGKASDRRFFWDSGYGFRS